MASENSAIVRAWCDGCFDMVHFGHANFLRQASKLCDELYVGVHNDEEIEKNKGPPVMTLEERMIMVEGIKWVKKAVPGVPYITTLDTLEESKCDFCIHGDDVTLDASGQDTYRYVREAGRFKECPRTKGVSTTNLVGRMLLMTKEHHRPATPTGPPREKSPYTGTASDTIEISEEIHREFLQGSEPKPGDRIIYVAGAFDLFHAGHVEFLEKARAMGDFLIVGLHSDSDVNKFLGANYPIMTLVERSLSVGACRFVDKMIVPAPFIVKQDFLDDIKPEKVVHGMHYRACDEVSISMYELPKKLGIYEELDSGSSLTTNGIVKRIIKNRHEFEERNRKKQAKEMNFIANNGSSS